jgi:uncharacterized membrane protein
VLDDAHGPARQRLAGLDGVRGLAALFMVVNHIFERTFPGYPAVTVALAVPVTIVFARAFASVFETMPRRASRRGTAPRAQSTVVTE